MGRFERVWRRLAFAIFAGALWRGDYIVGRRGLPLSEVPGLRVPVPPSAVRVLRELRAGRARTEHLRDEVAFENAAQTRRRPVQPRRGQLHQADRRGERASRLRERVERQHAPDRAAAADPQQCVREGHDGRRDLRRVRRAVGSRPAAGPGKHNGPHDQWGPGTRIPALVISPFLRGNVAIDHTQYDTTSILALIEERYGLQALSS